MRDRFLQVLLIFNVICVTVGCVTHFQKKSDIEDKVASTVSGNGLSVEDISTLEKDMSNDMVIYQSENFTVSIDVGTSGVDEYSQKIVAKWGNVDSVDKLCDIIQVIYSQYGCGLSHSVEYYDEGATSITVYELTDGQQMEYLRYEDCSIALRDKETSTIFWTSKEYDSNLGG